MKSIKINLEKSLSKYHSDRYLVGRLGNELLQEILCDYRKTPSIERAIQFINCLNYFYSTRIQIAEGRLNDNIIKIAKIFHTNWETGCNLNRIVLSKEPLIIDSVDKLREKIKTTVGKDLFSLTTKIFHQLNSQYPIYDSRIKIFFKKNMNVGRVNLSKSYSIFHKQYIDVLIKIGWPLNKVDEFDSAVWVYLDHRK